jgi:hypothetical protein
MVHHRLRGPGPFGNVLGVMYSQHYLDMLASGTAG